MFVRSVLSALSLAGMVYAGSMAMSNPKTEELGQCCDGNNECSIGVCCDAASVGQPSCSPEKGNYCMTSCRRGDG